MKFVFFILWSLCFGFKVFAAECKFDQLSLKTARETGDGIFCTAPGKEPDASAFYDLEFVEFYGNWKTMAHHGELIQMRYEKVLPMDRVRMKIPMFPTNRFKIKRVYAESAEGQKGVAARPIRTAKVSSTVKKPASEKSTAPAPLASEPLGSAPGQETLEYDFKTSFKEFRIVIEGETPKGVRFIQFSKARYTSTNKTDRLTGLETWKTILETLDIKSNSASAQKYLKEAFAK